MSPGSGPRRPSRSITQAVVSHFRDDPAAKRALDQARAESAAKKKANRQKGKRTR